MKAYIRIDPLIDERKGHYTPAQLGAYVMVLCKSARQTPRGRFRSARALKNMVPSAYIKVLPFLYDEGDLTEQDDGTVYVDGWDEWQEGDLTVGERMKRMRNRKRNAAVTSAVTSTVTQPYRSATTLDIDVYTDGSNEPQESAREDDPLDAYYRVKAGQIYEDGTRYVSELAEKYGASQVASMLGVVASEEGTAGKFLTKVAARLAIDSEKREKASGARRKAADAKYEADLQARIDNATPEERERAERIKAGISEFLGGEA